jgi:hypothetical protein
MLRTASVAVTVALVVLLPAAPAGAKELSAARACDADGCRTVTDRDELRALMEMSPSAAPTRRAPFHRVRMTISEPSGGEFHYAVQYVPALGLARERPSGGDTLWLEPSTSGIEVLDRLTRGLEPVPARRLRGIAPESVTSVAAPTATPSPPASGGDGLGRLLLLAAPVLAVAGWAAWRRWPRLHPRSA